MLDILSNILEGGKMMQSETSYYVLKEQVLMALTVVKDPEIDSINIIDLGMLQEIQIDRNGIVIQLLPTFMGCPALEIIKKNVKEAVFKAIDEKLDIKVEFIFHPPWTSDRITEAGREQLKEFGIAPPPLLQQNGEWHVECPYCSSSYTSLENIFGPTACRSILYCKACKNPFEAMKPISTIM
jgi:ring-1,2-phenylacetyl-CoA epoxidase subunit PaaD